VLEMPCDRHHLHDRDEGRASLIPARDRRQRMNRRLFWSPVVAVVAVAATVPLLAQNRQGGQSQSEEKAALAEHKAQEQREREAEAERAKRREAARAGQDSRGKARPQAEEEEEKPRDTP